MTQQTNYSQQYRTLYNKSMPCHLSGKLLPACIGVAVKQVPRHKVPRRPIVNRNQKKKVVLAKFRIHHKVINSVTYDYKRFPRMHRRWNYERTITGALVPFCHDPVVYLIECECDYCKT